MKPFYQVRYWTEREVKELQAALDAYRLGNSPVLYQGKWVRFRDVMITFHHSDLVTVDRLDIEVVEPPV